MNKAYAKLYILVAFFLCRFLPASAQLTPYYSFSSTTFATYVPLNSGTLIDTGNSIGDQRYAVTLPFAFMMDDSVYTQAMISANGFLSLGPADPGGTNYAPIQANTTGYSVISAFGRDLNSLGTTTSIRTQTTGTSPTRKFIVQWRNFSVGISTGITMNFQIVLHEGTNQIDIVYGTNTTSINTITGQVGLRGSILLASNYLARSSATSWTSTTAAGSSSATLTLSSGSLPPSGLTYSFMPPPACVTPPAPATALTLTPNYTSLAGSFSGPGNNTRFLVLRTPGTTPLNTFPQDGNRYPAGSAIGNGTVIQVGPLTTFSNSGLTQNTTYTYTVFPYADSGCSYGPLYERTTPLSGSVTTYGPKRYVWVGSSPGSYLAAANWQPQRVHADPGDTLVFDNGLVDTVTNVPIQTLATLRIKDNTTVILTNSAADSLILSHYLQVARGSSLTLAGPSPMKIRFATTGNRVASIDGDLNLDGIASAFDVRGGATSVSGTINSLGWGSGVLTACSSCVPSVSFEAGSSYNHRSIGGAVPYARWSPTSTLNIENVTTFPSFPLYGGTRTSFGNIRIYAPQASGTGSLSAVDTIRGEFSYEASFQANFSVSDLVMSGPLRMKHGRMTIFGSNWSTFQDIFLDTGTVEIIGNLTLNGDLYQTAQDTLSDLGSFITFMGVRHQNVHIGGQYLVEPYRNNSRIWLNNPTGVTLTGIIPVNQYSEVRVQSGTFDGSGAFSYSSVSSGAKLIYDCGASRSVSPVEWPVLNSPPNVGLNFPNPAPHNRLYMTGSRTISQTLALGGVLVLGNNDIAVTSTSVYALSSNSTPASMIVTNGTGRVTRTIGTSGTYNFPVGDLGGGNGRVSPLELKFTTNTASRNISVRVDPSKHPFDSSATDYLARHWQITDDGGAAAATYSAVLAYDTSDVVGNPRFSPGTWDGTAWKLLPGSVNVQSNSLVLATPMSTPAFPLTTEITARGVAAYPPSATYSWTGAVNKSWTLAGNWNPSRTSPSSGDILLFNDGLIDSVTNFPGESFRRIAVSNGTTLRLMLTGTPVMTLIADTVAGTDELFVEAGSAFHFNTAQGAALGFAGRGATATIAGRFEIASTSSLPAQGTINLSNCDMFVAPTGVLAAGTTDNGNPILSSPATLRIAGGYEHKYTSVPGYIPTATWLQGSQVSILGAFGGGSLTAAPKGLAQSFYDFNYNCPAQFNRSSWGTMPDSVRGTFRMISSGTASLSLGNAVVAKTVINKFVQTGGTFDVGYGAGSAIVILDSLIQTGGAITGPSSGNLYNTQIRFDGSAGRQQLLLNATPTGLVDYTVANPAGINIIGGPGMTAFTVNAASALRISTTAAVPVTSTLPITYAGTATLVFDSSGMAAGRSPMTADATLFPLVAGPTNLSLNTGQHDVNMPLTRVIPGTLRMQSGNINLGADTLTLGTGGTLATMGTLTYTSGLINVTTGGFRRWLTTSLNTGNIVFPIGAGGANRTITLTGTGATLSAAGTLLATHTAGAGMTTGLNMFDGGFRIAARSKASWKLVPQNGISGGNGGYTLRLTAGDIYPFYNAGPLRVIYHDTLAGNHVAGTGTLPEMTAIRGGLTYAAFADSAFYIGADAANVPAVFNSITTGAWNQASTWDRNAVPGAGSIVFISPGDTVDIPAAAASKWLTIRANGVLRSNSSTLAVDSAIQNDGVFLQTNGSLTLGPSGGGKAPFVSNGTLHVSGGTLAINGYLQISNSGFFTQTGGNIAIDGNAAGSSAGSVPAWMPFCNIEPNAKLAVTAGSITIVDPHYDNLYSNTCVFGSTGNGRFGPAHKLVLGDGVSTTSGGSAAFRIEAQSFTLGSLLVNASSSGTNRKARSDYQLAFSGNIELRNAGAQLQATDVYIRGDISLDAQTTVVSTGRWYFGDYNGGFPIAATAPQTISGSGTFQNRASNPTAAFQDITVNNSSPTGVHFSLGNTSFAGTLNFVKGIFRLNSGRSMTGKPGTTVNASATTGWVVGGFINEYITTGVANLRFPIGDLNGYTGVFMTPNTYSLVLRGGSVSISTTAGDHPQLSGSNINPAASLNRYFTLASGGGLIFNNTPLEFRIDWPVSDLDAGASPGRFIAQRNYAGVWSDVSSKGPIGATQHQIYAPDPNDFTGTYSFGESGTRPAIVSAPASQSVCTGMPVSFSVTSTGASSYNWQVNTGSGWSNITNGTVYSGAATPRLDIGAAANAMSGWKYRVVAGNTFDTSVSGEAVLTVGNSLQPAVTIVSNSGTTICSGVPVTFRATVQNGGTQPLYQWLRNAVPVGTGATYTDTFVNGDVVSCGIISNSSCASPATATSNAITLVVNPSTMPAVAITASTGTTICAGTAVSFTAAASNAGASPQYQWRRSGVSVGSNSPSYTDNMLSNGDSVTCTVTSSATCNVVNPVTSAGIRFNVGSTAAPTISIAVAGSTTICAGTPATFTSTTTNGGSAPQYDWRKNGVSTGRSGSSYSDTSLANGDVITCVLLSNTTCAAASSVTSNAVTMTVNPSGAAAVTVSATPAATVCAGTPVTFTANVVNGGNSPQFTWTHNGAAVQGLAAASYTPAVYSSGDVIRCVVISSLPCSVKPADTSAPVTITVAAPVTPVTTLGMVPAGTVCAGSSAAFSVVTNMGGGSFQWQVNGVNAGTNSASFSYTPQNGDLVRCLVQAGGGGCYSKYADTSAAISVVTTAPVAPALSITGNSAVCAGTQVTFAATGNIPGSSYQWSVNSANAGTNSSSFSYTPQNGDLVSCTLSAPAGACVSATGASSNVITMAVTANTVPTISISTPATSICGTATAAFVATTNITGGAYQWKVNGVNSGTNSPGFSYSPGNGDIVTCELTMPSGGCFSTASVTSSGITMNVTTPTVPSLSITTPSTTICGGTAASFTASANVSGVSYQWKVNGTNAGSGSSGFSYTPVNGDVVTCEAAMPAGGCFSAASVTSNGVTLNVTTPVVPSASISATSLAVCAGRSVSLSLTTNVTGAGYAWKVNGVTTGATAGFTFVPANGDIVTCELTAPTTGCFSAASITSNALSFTVTPITTPTLTIAAPPSVSAGNTVSLTATVSNAGSAYLISWSRNGVVFAQTAAAAASYVKGAGTDTITASIISTDSCYGTAGAGPAYVSEALSVPGIAGAAIEVYPSPFGSEIFVRGLQAGDRIVLTNTRGQLVDAWEPAAGALARRLAVRDLAPGVYFLKIVGSSGGLREIRKLVRR